MRPLSVIVVLGLLAVASNSPARTWYVERNGSGDFTTIQPAVDSAASGDTIRIGPGRYNEGQIVTCPGWTEFVRVLINKYELTLIGSGTETIIGQDDPYSLAQGDHMGIVAASYWSNYCAHIVGITFTNMANGIYSDQAAVSINNCLFSGNRYGIQSIENSDKITYCRFEAMALDGGHVNIYQQTGTEIAHCVFDGTTIIPQQANVSFSWSNDVRVEDCSITGGDVGVSFGFPSTGTVRRCVLTGQGRYGIWTNLPCNFTVEDCTLRQQDIGIALWDSQAKVDVRRCVIEDVNDCSIHIIATSPQSIVQNCDLAKGARYVVRTEETHVTYPTYYLDLRNNYWGTTSVDSIRAWIYDQGDGVETPYVIRYSPFRNESTPVERRSMSDMKALFGGR